MSKMDFKQYILEFDQLDSSNQYIKNNYLQLPNYTIIKTKYQTAGHGQFNRPWESEYDKNLLFSLLIKKELPFYSNDVNPIVVCALLNTLDEFNIEAHYQFPNDILVNNKKISGVFIETKYNNQVLEYMIIGVGLNINQIHFKNNNVTSIKQILKQEISVEKCFDLFLTHLSNNIRLANLMYLGEE